jgi:hypothetical protein
MHIIINSSGPVLLVVGVYEDAVAVLCAIVHPVYCIFRQ